MMKSTPFTEDERADFQRYAGALHGCQSAIAYAMTKGETLAEPKHLRVGVDSAHITHKAVAELLIDKGIITRAEYVKAQADAAEAELAKWEDDFAPLKFR